MSNSYVIAWKRVQYEIRKIYLILHEAHAITSLSLVRKILLKLKILKIKTPN